MTGSEPTAADTALLPGASRLISEAKRRAAQHPSAELTLLYWQLRRLAHSVLQGQQAAHGKQEMARLSKKLSKLYRALKFRVETASLRERFKLSASSSATISPSIAATMEAGLIQLDPDAPAGPKNARYLPTWA